MQTAEIVAAVDLPNESCITCSRTVYYLSSFVSPESSGGLITADGIYVQQCGQFDSKDLVFFKR